MTKQTDNKKIGTGKVARLFGVSDTTIRNWIAKGYLAEYGVSTYRLPSGALRFDLQEVKEALNKSREE